MSAEFILEKMPFDSLEELIDWTVSSLKDKEVKIQDLIDFFTIINGNQTILYDIDLQEDDLGTIANTRFNLFFAEYKVKLRNSDGKVSTYTIQDIEVQ